MLTVKICKFLVLSSSNGRSKTVLFSQVHNHSQWDKLLDKPFTNLPNIHFSRSLGWNSFTSDWGFKSLDLFHFPANPRAKVCSCRTPWLTFSTSPPSLFLSLSFLSYDMSAAKSVCFRRYVSLSCERTG